jgi:hypothetical protein
MEWTIPIQTFETSKLRFNTPPIWSPKLIVPMSYEDDALHFPSVSLLLPLLTVKSYDAATGQLTLSLQGSTTTLHRMQAIQDAIISAVSNYQRRWGIECSILKEEGGARDGFQPLLHHNALHLFCPADRPDSPYMFSKGVWLQVGSANMITPGQHIRVALRIQGISFHQHPVTGILTGKFRLQHKILGLLAAVS